MSTAPRPAFYALARGGWRDYVTLLHPPYTLWHLSYVALGAGLAPTFDTGRFLLTLAAFALAMGLGAHALDELNGRPLATEIPSGVLIAIAVVSVGAAVAIGLQVALTFDLRLLFFIAFGAFIVVAYNLELFGGRLHGDVWFALAWGAFPVVTAFFAVSGRLELEAVLGGLAAAALSLAQRRLSTQVRLVRRRVASVSGTIVRKDGRSEPIVAETLLAPPEAALRLMTLAAVALGAALVALRV
ncbi:MAG: hypothetical protein M3M94_06715 [Actinomycetota bacterium]|nr:hypothetical protein [Actinomycetota bacterium]